MIIGLSILCAVFALQIIVLWRKCGQLEQKAESARTEADTKIKAARDEAFDRVQQALNRILVLKGIRPIAEPILDTPRPRTPVLSDVEAEGIQDMIKEEMEHAELLGKPITREQAARQVWNSLGHHEPPMEM